MEDDEEEGFGAAIAVASECTEAEREFEKVLEELREAEGLKMYSDVYTKLYDSYYQLKDDKNKNTAEIEAYKTKMGRFDDTIADYQSEISEANQTIEQLRRDIEEARALADAMHVRELASVESLETIKKTVARLDKELIALKRQGDDDPGATSAAKEKEKFEKEKQRLQGELDGVRHRLAGATSYIDELEKNLSKSEDTIAGLEEQLEEAGNNAVRQGRLVDHLKGEVDGLKNAIEERAIMLKNVNDNLAKAENTIERRDRQIKEMKNKVEEAHAEQEAAIAKAAFFRELKERTDAAVNKCKENLVNAVSDIKSLTADNNKMRNEVSKLTKQGVQSMKKYQRLEQLKVDVEGERNGLRQQVSVMEREIMIGNKKAESDKRDIENLHREKEILNKSMQKIQNEAIENLHALNLMDNRRKQLETELDQSNVQVNRQRLAIRQLEKDKDRMLEEAIALNEKIDEISGQSLDKTQQNKDTFKVDILDNNKDMWKLLDCQEVAYFELVEEEVRLRTADIIDLQKELREEKINVHKMEVALDTTRAERNVLYKNYTDALDEVQDLKQKLKMLAYQIEQLKEDISGKETGLKSCEATLGKCNKKVEMLGTEVQLGLTKLADARGDIAALRQEEARLNRIVLEGDSARAKLAKELEGLMNERDVVGAQLVRRNDEISLLYEKIRILEVTLHRGERQYEQRVEDIRLLRLEIIRLRKEKNLLSKGIENMTDLRLEVFNLERELGRERLRVRALEEALETPQNVHRWRKLQGTDPEIVLITQKLRVTQKKVLAQSEMLVLKDRELKETKNLYSAVKDMLALQPSPEIQQTLNRTQRALAQRTSKMKCLIAELSMHEQQAKDQQLEMDRVMEELLSFKQKYYEMKRALDADEARRLRVPTPPTRDSAILS